MSPQLWCKLVPRTNQVTLAETGLKRDLTLALSYSCICASTKPQEGSTGMGTFWDVPCKNPTCSRAPGQLLSQEAAEIPSTINPSHAGRLLQLRYSHFQAVAEHV